jgi:hypothetical protein
MQFFPPPRTPPYPELKFSEAAFQYFPLTTPTTRFGVLCDELLQVVANEPGEGCILLDSNLPGFFDNLVIE